MNPLIRWGKFNLVGAMGMVVQLTTLALFNRLMRGHYLFASAAAIELTLLHNFIWHLHYTWRDRREGVSCLRQLVRFHLSNGLVSMLGNLVLMQLLVHEARLPVLVSNVIAILCCSVANFCLGNRWAFATEASRRPANAPLAHLLTLLLLLWPGAAIRAQTPAELDSEQGTDCAYENVFAGTAVSAGNKVSFTTGLTIGQYFARPRGKGITGSPQFELGIVGPLPGGHPIDGLVSVDYMFANKVPRRNLYPSFTGGYTRMFATGHAANFGVGIDFGKDGRLVRVELRDYYLFTGPRQHVFGLRIGLGKLIAD